VYHGKVPSHALLERCFTPAVRSYGEFSGVDPLSIDPWPVEKVTEFWRAHRHEGFGLIGATLNGEVRAVSGLHITVVCNGKQIPPVTNSYGFSIEVGDTVYFHNQIIAEVVKRNPDYVVR